MEISSGEVLRYLGYRKNEADRRTSALIEELSGEFLENAVPGSVYGIWDCSVGFQAVALDGMTVNSGELAKHLTGCRSIVLLAATLGPEASTMIRRYSVQDMGKAVIAQAVGAVMIEAYCDKIENEIGQRNELRGLCRTARYSPGYGDFAISHQKDIIRLLGCEKRIGLTLTDGCMLIPSKSVTAVIGFTEDKQKAGAQCEGCDAVSCEFREFEK